MAVKKLKKEPKKDFDKEQMYRKIMPSFGVYDDDDDDEEFDLPAHEPPQQLTLRNYLEDIVVARLDHTIETLNGCRCERCRKDVLAMVLNTLPSYYQAVNNDAVEEHIRALHARMHLQVSAALMQAVQQVKARPNH